MTEEKTATVLITIPEECRDKLRQLAAEAILENPKRQITGTGLAGKIVCSFLKREHIDILDIDPSLNSNNPPSSDLKDQNEGEPEQGKETQNE